MSNQNKKKSVLVKNKQRKVSRLNSHSAFNTKEFNSFIRRLVNFFTSYKASIFICILICVMTISYFSKSVTQLIISNGIYDAALAEVQTNAATLAGEFDSYEDFTRAKENDVFDNILRISAVNMVRVRIIDTNYKIIYDSYYVDYDKNILNSNIINAISTRKSASDFSSKDNWIYAIYPIINSKDTCIGAILLDKDISQLIDPKNKVNISINFANIAAIVVIMFHVSIFLRHLSKKPIKAFEILVDIKNGHTDERIPVSGKTELRKLAGIFNSIMDKSTILDQSRQEFVSNVSHELKTPITSIKILADSLNMQDDAPVEMYKEFMGDITSEIDRESKIIDDLLSLVRMDKAATQLNISSANLNDMLEMTLKRLKPIAKKKNVELLFESFRPVIAQVDESKITQVISNIVENAIKYNVNDGWVHVSLNADYEYFFIRIEDSGIGISEEDQAHIFERFYRVDKARSRETGGTGLGLSIVSSIILLHHGTIKVYSNLGEGTTFTIRIPLTYKGKTESEK